MTARKYPRFLTCEYCGEIFEIHRHYKKPPRFCSWKCKLLGYKLPSAVCLNCGKTFGAKAYHGKENRQKFCCISCRRVYQSINKQRVTIVCDRCGKEFKVFPSRLKYGNPHYCSTSCAGNMKRTENERFTRLKTTTWKEIRQSVITRDNSRCRICQSDKSLIVHHIDSWSKSKNDSPDNLITLCRSCHYKVEWYGLTCPDPLFPQ